MKMICPHCGLKGTAEETLLGKKVRCPECQKVFRVTEDVALVSLSTVSEQKEVADVNLQQPIEEDVDQQEVNPVEDEDVEELEAELEVESEAEEDITTELEGESEVESEDVTIELVEAEDKEELAEIELAEGVRRCSKCGFALSEKYLQETESEAVCVLCAG